MDGFPRAYVGKSWVPAPPSSCTARRRKVLFPNGSVCLLTSQAPGSFCLPVSPALKCLSESQIPLPPFPYVILLASQLLPDSQFLNFDTAQFAAWQLNTFPFNILLCNFYLNLIMMQKPLGFFLFFFFLNREILWLRFSTEFNFKGKSV